ncbi:unnamed protein product [Peniophora sp. CBMAI 1063]|nr:unnamed protein product [Peniophora sp. CBMAI 1063]
MLSATRLSALLCLALTFSVRGAPTSTGTPDLSIRSPQSPTDIASVLRDRLHDHLSQILRTLQSPTPTATSAPAKRQLLSSPLDPRPDPLTAEAAIDAFDERGGFVSVSLRG